MADFLEERISELIRMGSSYVDDYAVEIVSTSGGQEYRSLIHPYPVRKFDVSFLLDNDKTYAELQAIYHRAHGRYAGFRARCFDEWSSNGRVSTPTAFDQPLLPVSSGVYQLIKRYGTNKAAGLIGYAYREIKKPVAGTVLLGIGSTVISPSWWSINTTTGRLTLAANVSNSITGITAAASAVITVGANSFQVGHSVYISGVAGMTPINGRRATVTARTTTTITVDVNSTGFAAYTGGGTVKTWPDASETVTAGFEFDFPVRFNTTMPIGQDFSGYRNVDGVELIELLNP